MLIMCIVLILYHGWILHVLFFFFCVLYCFCVLDGNPISFAYWMYMILYQGSHILCFLCNCIAFVSLIETPYPLLNVCMVLILNHGWISNSYPLLTVCIVLLLCHGWIPFIHCLLYVLFWVWIMGILLFCVYCSDFGVMKGTSYIFVAFGVHCFWFCVMDENPTSFDYCVYCFDFE